MVSILKEKNNSKLRVLQGDIIQQLSCDIDLH